MYRILFIFGTRPEAIKMAPVIKELQRHENRVRSIVCITGQHREMLQQVLDFFGIVPDYNLDIMIPGQDLCDMTGTMLMKLNDVFRREQPDLVLVQGDTTSAMAGSLAAYYHRAALGHIEAGLRSGHKFEPFPEEVNRRIAGILADVHFAPTEGARKNLVAEGVDPETIHVTGNTVIDSVFTISAHLRGNSVLQDAAAARFAFLDPSKRQILVTAHRRENLGERMEQICLAVHDIADSHPDLEIVFPVHPNPQLQETVRRILGSLATANIHLVPPLDYVHFVWLLERSYLILTDSGGLQEEASALGKPLLILREALDRPEAVDAGTGLLVGASREKIVAAANGLLADSEAYQRMCRVCSHYGDGRAASRIVELLLHRFVGTPVYGHDADG